MNRASDEESGTKWPQPDGTADPPEESDPSPPSKARLFGLVALVVGSIFAYFGVIEPFRAMRAGAEAVGFFRVATVATPLVLGIAVLQLSLGPRAEELFAFGEKPTTLGWGVAAVLTVAGAVLYLWLQLQIDLQGYDS